MKLCYGAPCADLCHPERRFAKRTVVEGHPLPCHLRSHQQMNDMRKVSVQLKRSGPRTVDT